MPRAVMERLHRRYQGRVFAFDHPTVSVTPTENVRWLATHLPAGAGLVVDVVSHSRGGLVGRVLCERATECGLDPDRLRVRTLVMVGTPNAGTPLANDRHIGAFLDTFTNLLEFIRDNPVTDTLEVILTVVKQVAVGALKGLDGLQAQSSEGSYLSGFLNRSSSVKARYRALAANYEPGRDAPLSRFARDHLTDLVFAGAENDLVVPTQGVFAVNGGSGFPIADPVVFPSRDGVEHGGFWSRPRAIQAFDDWLVG
jgi:pimeloyl-ACP methyl ester carboxylesterase